MKLINKIFITCILLGFTCHANAWFFFFLPGSATRAIGDALTGAKGNICVKDTLKVGDLIPSSVTSNTAKVLSLSGTSSICPNPALPIRADVEFTFSHSSKAGIEIPDDYEPQLIKDLDRFNGRLMFGKSKSVSDKFIVISSLSKKPNQDIEAMANNFERSQINTLKNGSSKNSEKLKINGLNALRFEVDGSSKSIFGKDFTFLITLIDAGNEIMYINEWCPTSVFAETKSEFLNIVNSIKGLEGESVTDLIKTEMVQQTTSINMIPQQSLPTPATQTSASSNVSLVDKLEVLNDVLKKGLITQQDYDSKKAEILKSM
jgi:hypothetical protein